MLLLCALVAGSGSVWAKQYKLIKSTDQLVDGSKYLIVSEEINSKYYALSTAASNNRKTCEVTISGEVVNVTPATETTDTTPFEITLMESGEYWNLYDAVNANYLGGGAYKSNGTDKNNYLKTASLETSSGTTKYNGVWTISINGTTGVATITNQNNFIVKANPNNGTPLIASYTSGQKEVYLYREVAEAKEAVDGILTATFNSETGSIESNTWTMTDNNDYTLSGDGLAWKNNGFKIGYPKTFTITVPSGIAVSKVAISGYSSNTSTGTGITVGSTTKTFKTLTTYYFDISSPSAGADVTFTSASKEMYIMSIDLYVAGGISLTTTANMDGWRAFYDASQDYTLDANTKAYVVKAKSGTEDEVELTKLDVTAIPHGEAVILKTSAGDHKMTLTKTTGVATLGTNLLAAATGAAIDGYRLGYGIIGSENAVGFFKYAGTPAAGTVYIDKANVNTGSGAHGLSIVFDEDSENGDVTAIKSVNTDQQLTTPRKVMKDGHIVVESSKRTFTLSGARMK